MTERPIDIRKQAGSLGATIHGVDLAAPVSDKVYRALRQALLDHLVIAIRDQGHLTPEDQIAFGAMWGEIEPHPYVEPIDGYLQMIRIYDPNPLTETWHADFTYAATPPAFSFLLARVIPPHGGDTLFANAYAAYDGLSDGLQSALSELRAVHQGTPLALSSGLTVDQITYTHPIVRTHPETGRSLLYVNSVYVKHIEGWTPAESAALLGYLYAQFERPEISYRHRWHDGDMIIWDNRCAQHRVVGDTGGQERSLHRLTVADVVTA